MTARVLVAGIGNIFFADDSFGPAVVARLAREPIAGARIEDYGIRGLHLAFDLLGGYDAAVIVDAVARAATPGTLVVIEPGDDALAAAPPDAHGMDLGSVLGFVKQLGGTPPPIVVVGCQPESLAEGGPMSEAVCAAVETAVPLVRRVVERLIVHVAEEDVCEA